MSRENPRRLTYWQLAGIVKTIEEITYVQRDVLGMIANSKGRGLNFHNYEIAEQLLVNEKTVAKAIKELVRLEYIRKTGEKSPHRILYWTAQTKRIIREAAEKDKANKTPLSDKKDGALNYRVENDGGASKYPVTQDIEDPLQGCLTGVYNRSKEVIKVSKGDEDENLDKKTSISEAFFFFWELWPRRVGKLDAEKAWKKLNPGEDLVATIMQAVANQVKWREQAQGAFRPEWPHPATWLNGRRWTDEIKVEAAEAPPQEQPPSPEYLQACKDFQIEQRAKLGRGPE